MDVAQILSIRLSSRLPVDTLRWKHSENGIYSVRTGYYHDFSMWWELNMQENIRVLPAEIWRNCWKLQGPPRILTFLWRRLDNNIPVRDNLRKRGLLDDTLCPLCQSEPETVKHLFMECPQSLALIAKVEGVQSLPQMPNFALAWMEYYKDREKFECGRLLAALWGVWKVRNSCVFGDPTVQDREREMMWAIRFYDDYIQILVKPIVSLSCTEVKWEPPSADYVKINTDAGLPADGGGQVGAIARDSSGTFLQAAIRRIPTTQHPVLLEAYGLLLGLDLAKDLHYSLVVMESDCQPLIQALNGHRKDQSDLSILLEDCLESSKAFEDVRFCFVRRAANQTAHLLAKSQGPLDEIIHFLAVLLPEIAAVVEADVI